MTSPLEQPIARISLANGVWLEDDWYALKRLDPQTLAIGEPAYYQCNWSYLISDREESLLWDTGSGRRDLAPLIARHGRCKMTAFPSHMHYDHLGAVTAFGPVTLPDLPILRQLELNGSVTPPEPLFLGAYEDLQAPTFEVGCWVPPGSEIKVGTRRLTLHHTPGHSPDSVCLWEADRQTLFAADFIYPGDVYAQVPGACLPDYADSLKAILEWLPAEALIFCAHGQEEDGTHDVPRLSRSDLGDLLVAIESLLEQSPHKGALRVNARMELLYAPQSW